MKRLLRLPSSWLSLPLLFACALTWFTYDLSVDYLQGLLLLALLAAVILLFDVQAGVRLPAFARFRARHYAGTREAFLALALAALIVLACVLDLTLFPIPLLDKPSAYAVMDGGRAHVRHVSDMCWVLPPIGLLCTRSRRLRLALIAIGFVFPVLVIDRNRLFATFFSFALVLVLRREEARPLPWKTLLLLAFVGGSIFSMLGLLRSGPLEGVTLPFSAAYHAAPQGLKWLLLYATAGPYNFSAILAKGYRNPDFLINQLVPLHGSVATAGTGIPLDASNINVGTEFFPFLMAFGPVGAALSVFALYALLLWSVQRLRPAVPLFSLLMFLRMAYVGVMSPFAPQAFTWTNAGFIGICLLLPVIASWLPNRRAMAFPPSTQRVANHGTR